MSPVKTNKSEEAVILLARRIFETAANVFYDELQHDVQRCKVELTFLPQVPKHGNVALMELEMKVKGTSVPTKLSCSLPQVNDEEEETIGDEDDEIYYAF